jgi:hypothetical protein
MKNLLTREEAAAYLHLGPRGADWLKRFGGRINEPESVAVEIEKFKPRIQY